MQACFDSIYNKNGLMNVNTTKNDLNTIINSKTLSLVGGVILVGEHKVGCGNHMR